MTIWPHALGCACTAFLCFHPLSAAAADPIKLVSRGDANAAYAINLLQLALDKAGVAEQLSIEDEALTAPRLRQGLLDGLIDVIWTSTTKDLESVAIPVRIPLYKGLLGNRIFIVHKNNSNIFANVKSVADLKAFSYCQGRSWADTMILENNNLEVVAATKYEGLFHMVDGGRCHAFPRGVHEPWDELKRRPELELTIDPHVMLVYRSPYFFLLHHISRSFHRRSRPACVLRFLTAPSMRFSMPTRRLKAWSSKPRWISVGYFISKIPLYLRKRRSRTRFYGTNWWSQPKDMGYV